MVGHLAFPGGSVQQGACEFKGTRLVATWDNPLVDLSANSQHANRDLLPLVIRKTLLREVWLPS